MRPSPFDGQVSAAPADTRNGEYVSGNFFRTFGVQPWIGRLMTDADDQEGAHLLRSSATASGETIWFDASVVGAGYQINGHSFSVIGVAAPGFLVRSLPVGECRTSGSARNRTSDRWRELAFKETKSELPGLDRRVTPGVNPKSLESKLKVELHEWLASHVLRWSREKSNSGNSRRSTSQPAVPGWPSCETTMRRDCGCC